MVRYHGEDPLWQSPAHRMERASGRAAVLDDTMLRAIKADYDITLGRFGYLQQVELLDYQEDSAGKAYSRFADGTEIEADFPSESLVVNGEHIDCPDGVA